MMKRVPILLAIPLSLGLVVPSLARQSTPAPVPPPPGMHDPGVDTQVPPAPSASTHQASPAQPSLKDEVNERLRLKSTDADRPQVTTRKQGEDTVEEYRLNGALYMVRIVPESGPVQTFMVDAQGKLHGDPSQPSVRPVYYKIYEWGAPEKSADDSSR